MSRAVVRGGQVATVYSDRWRPVLEAMGALTVDRATDVEFDPSSGEWVATHRSTGHEIARGRAREQCIQAEVAWLTRRL